MSGLFTDRKTKKFGEIAVDKGLASQKDIDNAIKAQREYEEMNQIHKKLGAILTEKGVLTPDDVKTILGEQEKDQNAIMAWFYAFFGMSR